MNGDVPGMMDCCPNRLYGKTPVSSYKIHSFKLLVFFTLLIHKNYIKKDVKEADIVGCILQFRIRPMTGSCEHNI
jgi:hypothetical protein